MIIVEGVDNTGKTRLIGDLSRNFPLLKVIKSPGPTPDLPRWTMQELMESRDRHLKIYDRFFFSELVYGPVIRETVLYTPEQRDYILQFMELVAHPLVIMCQRLDAEESILEREQMEGVVENFRELSQEYSTIIISMLNFHRISWIPYNYQYPEDFERVKKYVARHLIREVT